jgi:xylulose-5-phosphate/fructose-6-phosphate phosphoketolase
VPSLGYRAAHVKQAFRDALIEHRQYIRERGDDPPEIRDWRWGEGEGRPVRAAPRGRAAGQPAGRPD